MARRVELDHKAKIAWVKNGNIALASFAFDQWGGANKAQMAAEAYMSDRTEDPWEMKARIEALERQVKAADALADRLNTWSNDNLTDDNCRDWFGHVEPALSKYMQERVNAKD